MPLINRNKVFEKIKRDNFVAGNTDVSASFMTDAWKKVTGMFKKATTATPLLDKDLQQLLEVVCVSCNLDERQQVSLQERFIVHVGRTSEYHSKNALEGSLKFVLKQLLLRVADLDKVRAISEKIIEGAYTCPEGFHNRINQIVLSLGKNDSLNGFLEQFRIEIVEKIAGRHTNEIHAVNRFYVQAASPYAIPVLNKSDTYRGEISDANILDYLKEGFSELYQFWGILNSLHEQMRNALTNATVYEGQKLAGYTHGEYEDMIIILSRYLPQDWTWLLMNDADIVVDLNWPIIMYQVWQTFTKEGYFVYSPIEGLVFEYLFNPGVPASHLHILLSENKSLLSSNDLFTNDTQLKMYVNDSVWFPQDKKLVFFAHYIANSLTRSRVDVGYYGQGIPAWMRDEIIFLLKQRGPDDNNALKAAMLYNTPVVPVILALIQSLSCAEQMEIYEHVRPSKKIDLKQADPILQHAFLEAEMGLLLMELKDKITDYQRLENSEPGRYQDVLHAVSTLRDRLLVVFNTYQQSEKNQQAFLELQTHCSAAINQSKQTILNEYPDVMAIVAQVLLFLTGVGALYLFYQAQNNYPNNRSLFFPSATEIKINEIEDTLNKISEVHAMR